jgi:hypothetical protein
MKGMGNKTLNIILGCIIFIGSIYTYSLKHNQTKLVQTNQDKVNQLSSENEILKGQLGQLEEQFKTSQQESTGLQRNIADYLSQFDSTINEMKTSLPALHYSTNEEHQVLVFANEFIQTNSYKGKPIMNDNEMLIDLEAHKSDKPSQIAVYIYTYIPQTNRLKLPVPTDIRLGGFRTMLVQKQENNTWKVSNIEAIF